MQTLEVTLPGGLPIEGGWHRTALLRPLCGRDEAFLAEEASHLLPAARTTALLARCLRRLGPLSPVNTDVVRGLSVGDREALLLHLRRLTLGPHVSSVLSCPNADCGEKLDLELDLRDLLQSPYEHQALVYERVVTADQARYLVRFRLPTGADQEDTATLAGTDLEAAVGLLLDRCVVEVGFEGEAASAMGELPAAVAKALPELMVELDPQAETLLELTCPACTQRFVVPFDAGDYLYREVAASRGEFYREIHLLALQYHWSEAAIMGLTPSKRRLYLELLADAPPRPCRE